MGDLISFLPPGFQFDPSDEELITYFLYRKVSNIPCNPSIIPELQFDSTDPWNLNGKALSSKNQYYFFSQLIGNRATEKGHWEERDMDETILSSTGKKLGIKKYLLFFLDEVQSTIQTSWFMEEYHLSKNDLFGRHYKRGKNQPQDLSAWVLCRVHDASTDSQLSTILQTNDDDEHEIELSFMDEVFLSMEVDEDEISFPN